MSEIFALSPIWRWSLVIIIGFPVLMVLMTEAVLRLEPHYPRFSAALRSLRNWVLPTTALYVFVTHVLLFDPSTVLAKTALTLIFLAVLNSGLTLLNLAVFGKVSDEKSWRSRVPDLLRDLGRALIVLIGAGFTLSRVWGHDLGSIITALSVGSLVVGLALQETLGNVFAGVSLLIERPFVVGDFIQIGEIRGYVTSVSWRSTQMRTLSGESIVIPNNVLAKETFRNLSRPTKIIQEKIQLGFSYDHPPERVHSLMTAMLIDTPGVIADPAPVVWTKNYADSSITYELCFWIESVERQNRVRHEVMTRVWYVAKREGLEIPYPTQVAYEKIVPAPPSPGTWSPIELALKNCAALSFLNLAHMAKYEPYFKWKEYAQGEAVVKLGDTWDELIIIAEGQLQEINAQGVASAHISQGSILGEFCLNEGEKADKTYRAEVTTKVLCFYKEGLRRLIVEHPETLRPLGDFIEHRRQDMRQRAIVREAKKI
jgi:small-conductance mechanosensitive channel